MYEQEMIDIRRSLHRYPELSFKEVETSNRIAQFLDKLGVTYKRIETAVIAVLDTGKAGKHLCFRGDMDALALQELNDHDYVSEQSGVMHGCGHDAHTTILLFTVKSIQEQLDDYKGKFTFIFQHAEEIPPGGAKILVEAGVMEGVDSIYGLHCDPEYDVGQVMCKAGPLMAAVDKFQVKIIGKGGHGAMPHLCIDPIVVTAQIIVNLQTVISRSTDPLEAALITIGILHGGESFNVIPESLTFEGTVRTLSKEVRSSTEARIRSILDGMTQAYNASYEIEWLKGYPVLNNDAQAVKVVESVAGQVFGKDGYCDKKEARLLGEDFASYLNVIPGAFFFLGTRGGEDTSYPLHSPRFDIDERALAKGVEMFTGIAKWYNS